MRQIEWLQSGGSLFAYAFAKLRPDIFTHPIWVRFGRKEVPVILELIDDLLSTTKTLTKVDPSTACQVLLICAVYQNYAGQQLNALRSIQQALTLAKNYELSKEINWAMWGACAISYQHGNVEQAAHHLLDLQIALNEQNEWILASFIDVLKEYLFQLITSSEAYSLPEGERPFKDFIALTLDWLQYWGFFVQTIDPENRKEQGQPAGRRGWLSRFLPSFSFKRWKFNWKSLVLAFQGELKLQLYQTGGDIETQTLDKVTQFSDPLPVPLAKSFYTDSPVSDSTSSLEDQKNNIDLLSKQKTTTDSIAVQMLGTFSIIVQDITLKLSSSRSLSLLKYLLLHYKQSLPREVLMEVFWPEAAPETARNNLNVAIYSLRRALQKTTNLSVIVYENGTYGLAPNLQVWLDVEEFERCVQAGKRLETHGQVPGAVIEYETAISIYQGDFLEENPYEEWTVVERERLRITYLDMLDRLSQIYFAQERYALCITVCQLILIRDRCYEDAHCMLMRCYSRQGQRHLALRQYHVCVEAIRIELDVTPDPPTSELYEKIRSGQQV